MCVCACVLCVCACVCVLCVCACVCACVCVCVCVCVVSHAHSHTPLCRKHMHPCMQAKTSLSWSGYYLYLKLVNAHIGVDDIVLRHMYLIHTGIAVCLPLPFPLSSPLSPSSRHPFPLSLSSPPHQGLLHLILNKLFPCCLHHHCLQIL